ncbi:DUF4129 domain-containing protein [Allostreptomyces psammosilenae]|uniref:Protein-glutamine gamma-glutamyltransferase-like C-terminal domain-containing protein n=1 Tax=Allostreptomyces psammosilenae TaxID=1892865 RepID=A0A852ZY54_9ACTN|nr:DUF4129 domain-containing protein [Allostreptomyces psammosilenae]NYI06170.1 hypothetical protein [Allostreptomyces psammosilenae]
MLVSTAPLAPPATWTSLVTLAPGAASPGPSAPPLDIDGETAREAARDELSRAVYQDARPGPIEQAWEWFWERVAELLDATASAAPGGWVGVVTLLVIALLAIVALRLRLGRMRAQPRSAQPLLGGVARSAAEHRAAAERHAAAGAWPEAVGERMRAIARALHERALLDDRPGRTATEIARDAAAQLPQAADALAEAARIFDGVRYGGRTATAENYATMRALDDQIAAARPMAAAAGTAPAGWAVPSAAVPAAPGGAGTLTTRGPQ